MVRTPLSSVVTRPARRPNHRRRHHPGWDRRRNRPPDPGPRLPARPRPLHQVRRAQGRPRDRANSIDNLGRIVGSYVDDDADATYHGFLRDARGRFATIDLPGAKATVANRINDRGQIVGSYENTNNGQLTPIR